ncbi:MAG: GDP-mannose 4,6-dehydratase [Candidatus Binatia bacterium]
MNWQGHKVLVTGAGGFLGSHLAEHLVALGGRVRVFVRYNSRGDMGLLGFVPAKILNEMEVVAGDLCDTDAVRKAVQGCETVFHLGAMVSIPYSYLHPREVVKANVLGTLNVLEAARSGEVGKLVHTSTSEVYGTAHHVPMDERHPLRAQSPYSASKIGADSIVESYWRTYGTPVVVLRPFNTYGPRQSARAVIPTIITQALVRSNVCLGNLNSARDFTYMTDTVAAFVAVVEADGVMGQEINIGSGSQISIGELAQRIVTLVGRPVTLSTEDGRLRPLLSEVEQLCADNRKAKQLLGWSPRIDLDVGLSRTVTWINEHLDLYQTGTYQV